MKLKFNFNNLFYKYLNNKDLFIISFKFEKTYTIIAPLIRNWVNEKFL